MRAWEKRYSAVTPLRTVTKRRLYSDADIQRLILIRRAIAAGRTIGHVATLSDADLSALLTDDADSRYVLASQNRKTGEATGEEPYFSACIAAVKDLNARELETALSFARAALSQTALLERLLIPLTQTIGDLWQAGELRVTHEHMASAIVRTFVGNMKLSIVTGSPSRIVVATPAGQRHEFGALIAAAVAAMENWDVTYLGPDIPADDIAAAAGIIQAEAVALSIVYPAGDVALSEELYRLRKALPDHVMIIAGGHAASSYSFALQEIGALVLDDMTGLRNELRVRSQAKASVTSFG